MAVKSRILVFVYPVSALVLFILAEIPHENIYHEDECKVRDKCAQLHLKITQQEMICSTFDMKVMLNQTMWYIIYGHLICPNIVI